MASTHPQFDYWQKVLQFEVLFLQFMRSQREQRFMDYVESLGKIIPWMFALDHYCYTRWMTIHVRDLVNIENCPAVHAQFLRGNFVIKKTSNKFFALAHDLVHEQLNAMVKGDGDAIGLTENEAALTRWIVAGPETARMLQEYDEKYSKAKVDPQRHHEQTPSVQKRFASHVNIVTDVIEEIGNPFSDTLKDLYALDTKVIMPDSVIHSIRTAEDLGKAQYNAFVQERINGHAIAFSRTIQKNRLPLFNTSLGKVPAKTASKVSNLQNDMRLFSRMYISCQARNSDMDAFFSHENHAWPPSLASNNMLQTTKSDLMECLESLTSQPNDIPEVNVKIVDGAAVVHLLDPEKPSVTFKTFQDYAHGLFLPYIERMLRHVVRVDIVWDVYQDDSLKYTRQNRGTGRRTRVANNTSIPANWKNFLRVDAIRDALFKFLAATILEFTSPQRKQIISTHGQNVV